MWQCKRQNGLTWQNQQKYVEKRPNQDVRSNSNYQQTFARSLLKRTLNSLVVLDGQSPLLLRGPLSCRRSSLVMWRFLHAAVLLCLNLLDLLGAETLVFRLL